MDLYRPEMIFWKCGCVDYLWSDGVSTEWCCVTHTMFLSPAKKEAAKVWMFQTLSNPLFSLQQLLSLSLLLMKGGMGVVFSWKGTPLICGSGHARGDSLRCLRRTVDLDLHRDPLNFWPVMWCSRTSGGAGSISPRKPLLCEISVFCNCLVSVNMGVFFSVSMRRIFWL